MSWMLRNSRGRPDALLTMATATLAVVLVKVLLRGVIARGMNFGDIDAGIIAALLGPTLGAYAWKRTTVDRDHGTALPPAASSTLPLTTRGFAAVAEMVALAVLVAIGLGIYLFALPHRGSP